MPNPCDQDLLCGCDPLDPNDPGKLVPVSALATGSLQPNQGPAFQRSAKQILKDYLKQALCNLEYIACQGGPGPTPGAALTVLQTGLIDHDELDRFIELADNQLTSVNADYTLSYEDVTSTAGVEVLQTFLPSRPCHMRRFAARLNGALPDDPTNPPSIDIFIGKIAPDGVTFQQFATPIFLTLTGTPMGSPVYCGFLDIPGTAVSWDMCEPIVIAIKHRGFDARKNDRLTTLSAKNMQSLLVTVELVNE